MYDIIKRYVDNENKNGLMLIDMPTGSGKTYSAIKYIFDACMDPQNKDRKYIFVTTLKKNLPYDDLQKWFNSIGKSELYQEKVLVIDSNMDSVVDGWSPEVESAIPAEIKKSDEYKNFQRDLSFVKRQREEKTLVMREFLDSIESNLREKTEPRFRRLVSDYLAKEYVTVEQRLYAVKTDKKWQWLGKLYPAVFTRDRQVLFLSMDKLLSRNTTIVEPSYMFYNSDIVKNAVIFIDDFKAALPQPLVHIIEETVLAAQRLNPEGAWMLSTHGTRASGLYQKYADKHGYTLYLPNEEQAEKAQQAIFYVKAGELDRAGDVTKALVEELWRERDLPVMTACTELPLGYAASGLPLDSEGSSFGALVDACIRMLYDEVK